MPEKSFNILLNVTLTEEPNETQMTVIFFDGNQMEFRSFHGMAAADIYNILRGKEETNDIQ